ncbi:MAG: peptide deformylase [Gemmatimonadales bacterium]
MPDLYGEVARPTKVVLGRRRRGKPFRRALDRLVARAVQHELDHLDGVLYLDHLSLLKRQRLLSRWKKEHKGESFVKKVIAEDAKRR